MCEWASHHRHSFSPNSARLETHRRGSIGPPSKTQRAHQTSVCTGHPEGQSDPCPRRSIRPLSQHQTPGESNRQLPAENPQCLSDLRLQQIPRRSNTPLPLHQIINTSYQKLPFGSGNDPDPASDTRRGQSDLYNRHSEGQSNTYPSPEGQSDPLPLNPRLNRRQGQSGTCVYQTPRWSIELLPVHQTPWGGQSDLCPCDECNRHPEGQTNQTICLRHLRGQTPSSATRRTVMGSSGLPNSAAGIRRTNHAPACVSHAGSANQFGSFLTKMSRIVINKRNATFSRIVTYLSRKIDVIFRV